MFNLFRRKDPTEEALVVAEAFLVVLESERGGASILNERKLAHPKNTIRYALLLLIGDDGFGDRRLQFINALLALASFQRLTDREEGYVQRRRLIMAAAAAHPENAPAAMFELELLESEARGVFERLEHTYELDIERYEDDLANLGAEGAPDEAPSQGLPRRHSDAS